MASRRRNFAVFDDQIRDSETQQDNIVVEYITDEYMKSRYDNSGNRDKYDFLNGYIYDSIPRENDIGLEDVYHNIRSGYYDEEEPKQDLTKTVTFAEARALPTNYNDRRNADRDIRRGNKVELNKADQSYKKIDTTGHDEIQWTELSMLEIIKLQGCGVFDRAVNLATNDHKNNRSFFNSKYPLLIFKIRAPCVMFSNEIPTTGRGADDNSNLTLNHVTNFDKWIVDENNFGEIRVWYSLQNSLTSKLFVNNKLVSTTNIQIRYWHENGLMYVTQFNADLIETMPSVVKISHNSIAKNIMKIGNQDDPVFEISHKLQNTSYNHVVTTYLVYMKDEVDNIIETVLKENPRKSEKQLLPKITAKLLNNPFETNEHNDVLNESEILDPIIRITVTKMFQSKMSQAFKKAVVSMKKENTLNLTSFETILENIPFDIDNDINLLVNHFDQLLK